MFTRRQKLDSDTARRLKAIRQRSRGLSRSYGERETKVTPRETMRAMVEMIDREAA